MYKNWTKIHLTAEMTQFLYECYQSALGDRSKVQGVVPGATPLLKTFDGGTLLFQGQEKYLTKTGALRPISLTYPLRQRICLSVIQVKGEFHYRIFCNSVDYNQHTYTFDDYRYKKNPLLTTNPNVIQISRKEKVLTRSLTWPLDYKKHRLAGQELDTYLKENNFTPNNNYFIVGTKFLHKTPLTIFNKIIKEWSHIEEYIAPFLNDLLNHESFN